MMLYETKENDIKYKYNLKDNYIYNKILYKGLDN